MDRTPLGKKPRSKTIHSNDSPFSKKSRTEPHIVVENSPLEEKSRAEPQLEREYTCVDSQGSEGGFPLENAENHSSNGFEENNTAKMLFGPDDLEDRRIKIEGEFETSGNSQAMKGGIETNALPGIESHGDEEENPVDVVRVSQDHEDFDTVSSSDANQIPQLEPVQAAQPIVNSSEPEAETVIYRRLTEGSHVPWKGKTYILRSWKSSEIEKVSLDDPPLDDYQQTLLDEIVPNEGLGKNVWITGAAGTGKSVLLRAIIKKLKGRNVTFAVAAPTGVAAFQVGGQTLHSWFGYQDDGQTVKQEAYAISVLIIDEISMMDANMLEFLSNFGKRFGSGGRPFGGIQVIVCGDFLQLPPVPAEKNAKEKYAFETNAWKECAFRVVVLKKVHRQANADLVQVLSDVRQGTISRQTEELLKSRCGVEHGEQVIKLRAYAKQVNEINMSCFQKLPEPTCCFTSVDTGDARELNEMRVPAKLDLRVGARVMLVFNLSIDNGLVNGACGTVVGFHECNAFTSFNLPNSYDNLRKLAGTGAGAFVYCPIVLFDGWGSVPERLVQIEPKLFRSDGVTTVSGESESGSSRLQIPLVLAYAITIHKSQGLTLARYNVDIRENFANGQSYVALSRASSIESLSIEPFETPLNIAVSEKARKFQNNISESERDTAEPELVTHQQPRGRQSNAEPELVTRHEPQCPRCFSRLEADGAPFWKCSPCLATYGGTSHTWDQSTSCRRCSQHATIHCVICGRSLCNQCLATNSSKCCRDCV